MQPTPDGPTDPAARLAGRYRLTRRLGRGAMGTVFEAHDEHLDRWVAIKRVSAPASLPRSELDQVRTRAYREARAIASISDPHVVTVFDLLEDSAGPAIVMEFLEAVSIAEILSGGALTESQAATVGLAVTSALMSAHAARVTHRDVKPGNVLLCRDGRIKLTDFGIARNDGEQAMTATGLLLGSPAYISPEVASGKPAEPAADIWGLGALLFACVEGRPPYDAGDPLATLNAVVKDPIPKTQHAGRLTALIGSLLLKDPRRRMNLAAAHRILTSLVSDPMATSLVVRVWGSPAVPGQSSRRRPPPSPRRVVGTVGPPARPLAEPSATLPPAPTERISTTPPNPSVATGSGPHEALPPPPWASADTAGTAAKLRALPAASGPPARPGRSTRVKVTAAILAVMLGAAGFLGARWAGHALATPAPQEPASQGMSMQDPLPVPGPPLL